MQALMIIKPNELSTFNFQLSTFNYQPSTINLQLEISILFHPYFNILRNFCSGGAGRK